MKIVLNTPALLQYHGATSGEPVEIEDTQAALYLKRGQAYKPVGKPAAKATRKVTPKSAPKKKAGKMKPRK